MSINAVEVSYRSISEFPGYRAGDDGSIWSRWNWGGSGSSRGTIGTSWRRLKPKTDKDGYLGVTLLKGGIRHSLRVHRLILETFVGLCPDGMEACHYPDRSPANCRLGNLRWDTWHGNLEDRISHGTHLFGESHAASKMTEAKVIQIRQLHAAGLRQVDIGARFGITQTCVSAIVRRSTWRHVS